VAHIVHGVVLGVVLVRLIPAHGSTGFICDAIFFFAKV
jgi:hypothetical protein